MYHYNLGQLVPPLGVQTILRTAPTIPNISEPVFLIDTIFISNLDFQSGEDLVSLRIVKNGDTANNNNALLNNYTIQTSENIVKGTIYMSPGDLIMILSSKGKTSFQAFGRCDVAAFEIAALQTAAINGTITNAEKEKLMLLTGGAYVIQNNTNNCSCP